MDAIKAEKSSATQVSIFKRHYNRFKDASWDELRRAHAFQILFAMTLTEDSEPLKVRLFNGSTRRDLTHVP